MVNRADFSRLETCQRWLLQFEVDLALLQMEAGEGAGAWASGPGTKGSVVQTATALLAWKSAVQALRELKCECVGEDRPGMSKDVAR